MVIIDDGHLGDTVIADNIYISSNTIPEIRDLFLFYLHIDDKNTLSIQSKRKIPKILPFAKVVKVLSPIQFWSLMMIMDQFARSPIPKV